MLKNIRIHKTAKLNWYNLSDCAKVLGARVDNLSRRSYVVTKLFTINGQKKLYANEYTLRTLFAGNKELIAELDHYLLTGQVSISDKYAELLFVSQLYLMNQPGTHVELPGLRPLPKANLSSYLKQPLVLQALVRIYTRIVFYETPDNTANIENVPQYAIAHIVFSKFTVKLDIEYLYSIYQTNKVPDALIQNLLKAEPIKSPDIFKDLLPVITNTDFEQVLKSRSVKSKNFFEYPITCDAFVPVTGAEVNWLGT